MVEIALVIFILSGYLHRSVHVAVSDFQSAPHSALLLEVPPGPSGSERVPKQDRILVPPALPNPELHRVNLLHPMEFCVRIYLKRKVILLKIAYNVLE